MNSLGDVVLGFFIQREPQSSGVASCPDTRGVIPNAVIVQQYQLLFRQPALTEMAINQL